MSITEQLAGHIAAANFDAMPTMPTVSIGFETALGLFSAEALVYYEPTLLVKIGFDPAFATGQVSRPNLPQESFPALVDTGADINCIDFNLAADLGLPVLEEKQSRGLAEVSEPGYILPQFISRPCK